MKPFVTVVFYALPDSLCLFVFRLGYTGPAFYQLQLSRDDFLQFQRTYLSLDPNSQVNESLVMLSENALYAHFGQIAEKIAELTAPNEPVCFVPSRELAGIPFHAVPYSKSGEPLLFRNPIFYTSTVTALRYFREMESLSTVEQDDEGRVRSLVLGVDSQLDDPRYIEAEALEISELKCFEGDETRLGADATTQILFDVGTRANILHLSCHGAMGPDTPSFLLLANNGQRPTKDDRSFFLSLKEISSVRFRARHVTLNACWSGAAISLKGNVDLGIGEAFQASGVASVLVNRWTPTVDVTIGFMRTFYTAWLEKGESRCDAVRRAMLETRGSGRSVLRPFFWAGYFLYGWGG